MRATSLAGFLAGLVLGFWLGLSTLLVSADAPPVSSQQPRPDIFECGANCDLQIYNALTQKAKASRSVTYKLLLVQGCSSGTIPSDMRLVEQEAKTELGLTLTRNDTSGDFTIYISCGSLQVQKCGSVYVFCLPDRYPQTQTVYISDVLSTWQPATRTSILLHEVVGHAVGTWNEQYARCAASCGFASSPGWRDFMNTGVDSRHDVEAIECGRWMRTMWEDAPCAATYGYAPPPPPESPWGPCDATWGNCWLDVPAWVFPDGGICVPNVGCYSLPD